MPSNPKSIFMLEEPFWMQFLGSELHQNISHKNDKYKLRESILNSHIRSDFPYSATLWSIICCIEKLTYSKYTYMINSIIILQDTHKDVLIFNLKSTYTIVR